MNNPLPLQAHPPQVRLPLALHYTLSHTLTPEPIYFSCTPAEVGEELFRRMIYGLSDVCRDALAYRAAVGRLPALVGQFWTLEVRS